MAARPLLVLPAMVATLVAGGCASRTDVAARLAPRAAEAINPRIPIPSEEVVGPVSPALAEELRQLVAQAEAGDRDFVARQDAAASATARAGAPQSESWIEAQLQVSALIAARAPVTRAMGDIDALGSEALVTRGYILAGDRKAVERAAATVSAIDEREAALVQSLGKRLGG
ncbi:MAG TPA: hypothetical protein VHM21_02105 [Sphingomicrobium sp.]|nr:hypothetical protein [Sphingomicrobium sp.]